MNEIIKKLINEKISISFAESITGGLLPAYVTNFPGSSNILSESYVVYSNESKKKVLGVSEKILEKHSVYSKECVKNMTEGLKKLTNSDICISTSGVAGPSSGSKKNPVGTVYYDILYKNKHYCQKVFIKGSRREIREKTVNIIFKNLGEIING